ncbi:MAG: ATP-binding cassette domain-containing protein, partial [Myxococcota bacterium]
GAGKSTLLKILAGVEAPSAGECRVGHNVSRYYFAQHQSDALEPNATPLEALREVMPLESESRVRGILGSFLFTGDDVDKKIRVLSGGERARVVLARMLAQPANLLLLDEPTNHLDLQARSVLESALEQFPGTVVLVSHDRYFVNRLATSVLEIRPGGTATSYLGDYDYYLWKKAEAALPSETAVKPRESGPSDYETRKKAKREREKLARVTSELESKIGVLEARIAEIDQLMADDAVLSDNARLSELHEERQAHDTNLAGLYDSWERSQAALDKAAAASPP